MRFNKFLKPSRRIVDAEDIQNFTKNELREIKFLIEENKLFENMDEDNLRLYTLDRLKRIKKEIMKIR